MTTNRSCHAIIRFVGATLLAASIAGGAWAHGAPTALAPEPAKLTGTLALSVNLQSGPGSYLTSGASTTILRTVTASSPSASQRRPDGTPCTTTWLAPGATTTKVIHNLGSSMLCY